MSKANMQYIDETKMVTLKKGEVYDTDTLMQVLAMLDEKMKGYGLELTAKKTLDGDMVIDLGKKKITRTRRTRRRKGGGLIFNTSVVD